jgi:hypothetical protein
VIEIEIGPDGRGQFGEREQLDIALRQVRHTALQQSARLGQLAALALGLLVQARVLDRHGRLAGEGQRQLRVILAVEIQPAAVECDHAGHAVLQDQRHAPPADVLVGVETVVA